ncbi:MAG: inosine/xanthosine triphosphatase [Anaerolineales bacterium]
MPIVIIASTNPVKIDATRQGFEAMFAQNNDSILSGSFAKSKDAVLTEPFHFQGVNVPSGVKHQPMTDAETLTGARTRAGNARAARPDADFWVGIEGGVEIRSEGEEKKKRKGERVRGEGEKRGKGEKEKEGEEGMQAFAWVVILGKDLTGEARTGTFQLPPKITRLVRQGVELGHADDLVFQRSNSKQKDGAIGILTDGLIDRTAYYAHAVMLALVPFKKRELYVEG